MSLGQEGPKSLDTLARGAQICGFLISTAMSRGVGAGIVTPFYT